MKRTGYLYEEIYELENLKTAHRNARKDKLFYEEHIRRKNSPQ